MSNNLMGRVAILLLPGAFLIPIVLSGLGDRTHVVTCEDQVETPFTIDVPASGPATVGSATGRITRGKPPPKLCGNLRIDLSAERLDSGKVRMELPITNRSSYEWRGTIEIALGETSVPIDIGAIPPGETARDEITLDLDPGRHSLEGSVLLGP